MIEAAPVESVSPAGIGKQPRRWLAPLLLALLAAGSTATAVLAMRHTSATFDEITTVTVGARGWETGDWEMMPDFPPVMQYLYGLPVYLSDPVYPADTNLRYMYARSMLWESGNDGETLMFRGRLVAAAAVGILVLLTFFFARAYFGPVAALLAAGIVAFLPDVLAHGGVAYNDIALAPAFMAGLWALDRAVRNPTPGAGLAAGILISLALGIKHSALALGPIAVLLVAAELAGRQDRRAWLRRIAPAVAVALLAGYLLQVLLYRGDFTLTYLRGSTRMAADHIGGGHGMAYLLGVMRSDAWWYFYPVAFLFKTPVAFHLLLLLALLGAARAAAGTRARALLTSPVRAPVIALLVFGFVLVRANLVIGFRYALPLLPLLAVLAAAGCAELWARHRALRAVIVALVLWSAASTLSFYPHFLAYTSEHQPDPDRGWEVFVDSSLDWGQGLIALREFMEEERIPQVYLAYFGSALPEGYGIDYIPLPGVIPLEPKPIPAEDPPRFVVVSATHLVGQYLSSDVYGPLREREPYRVLGHTLYVYEAR